MAKKHPVKRERKKAEEIIRTEIVMPSMTNTHGTMFGGKVLEMMDLTCGIASMSFCRKPVVTISSDQVEFKVPIRTGHIIQMRAKVVYTGNTSMSVKVDLFSQHPAEDDWRLCTSGYFNFVALDRTGRKTVPVPQLILDTDEDRKEWERAKRRIDFLIKNKNS